MASEDVVMAGFGGQGLMAIGKILAKAAMQEGRHVTWLPSYGPEMRGGTANCVVIIDDDAIGSPVVKEPRAAIVMNKQSIDKFEPTVKKGGLLIVNKSLIDRKAARSDLRVIYVDANAIAENEGSGKSANMVALGAYVGAVKTTTPKAVEHAIAENFKDKRGSVGDINVRAFLRGLEIGSAAK
ncbi:MAG: 2-oxoacid:acceptor oxidoreductase family protein [Deltaproteobacteria bacterium]|nr:2-oxoacid:acceptor oxidoreductase family protein [Deltaproteobacteria bacterium]